MVLVRGSGRSRFIAVVVALLAGVAALVGLGLLGGAFADVAPIDGSSFVSGLSAQALPDGKTEESDWVDLTDDAHAVSVYDGVRFNVAFAVPRGTLSDTANVVRFPVKGLRFHSEAGGDVAVPAKGSVYRGAEKWAEFNFDGYDRTAKQEYLTLTFTDVAVRENALTDLTDGHVWFNVDTAGVFPTGTDQTVTVGAKSTPVTVNRPKVTLTKVANPDQASQTTPYNDYVWTITVKNESSIPLKNAFLFDCRIGSMDQKADYSGDCFSDANTASGKRWDDYSQSGFYGASWGDEFTLAANETKTITFTGRTSMTELANNVPNIYNMALLYDTKGVTGGVGASGPSTYAYGRNGYAFDARAEQVNPYYGKKDSLKIEKAQDTHETRYVNRKTGAACKYGDAGCSVQIGWTVKVTNEGEGAAAAGWSLQERGVGTWFAGKQIDEIVDSIKKAGGFTDVQWVTECDSPGYSGGSKKNRYDPTFPDIASVYDSCPEYNPAITPTVNLIGSGNITVNEPLAPGKSFTFTYHTTAGAEEGDPMVGGRNCAYTADSSGTVVDQKCIGVEYGVENLSKNAVAYPYGGQGNAQWHIGYSLTGDHVGKTLVLHESIPDGVSDVRLAYVEDEKEGSTDVDKFDWFGYYNVYSTVTDLDPTDRFGTTPAALKVGETWTDQKVVNGKWTIGRYALKRTGEKTFDIIINDAPARGYVLVATDKVDPKYVADNGLAKSGANGYCATLKVTNTVTSDLAESLDDAKEGKYIGAFRKTAKSDEVPYTVCTNSTKYMTDYSYDFQTDQGTSKTYSIDYNKAGFQMNGGKDVTITDSFENLPGDASAALMPIDGEANGSNNVHIDFQDTGGYLCGGQNISDAGDTTDAKSCKDHVDWNPVTGVLKFTGIPDGREIRITYRVLFNSPKTSIPALKNDFTVGAAAKATGVTDGNSTNDITLIHSGGTIDANSIYVQKFGDSKYTMLPGAVFTVQKWDAAKKDWVDDAKNKDATTSGTDGLAVISNMDCGVAYKVWEKTAPKGYKLDDTPQYVMLKCADGSGVKAAPDDYGKLGGNIVVAGATLVYNDQKKPTVGFDLVKVDSKDYDSCGTSGCDGSYLAGTEWTLESSDENGTTDGKVRMSIVDNGENDEYSTVDGSIGVSSLDPGYYRLTEEKAPNGYVKSTTPIVLQLQLNSWGGTTMNWISGPAQSGVVSMYGSPTLVVANGTTPPKPKPSIAWTKVDANDATQLLPGSEWDLRDAHGKTTHVIDNGANDKDPGDGKLKVEGVEDGTYYLTETKAPTVNAKGEATDYQLDTSTRTVTVKDGTATISNTTANAIPNKPKGATGDITWSKVDAEDDTNLRPGSAWTLTVDGNQYTIPDNGKATDAHGNDAPQYNDVDATDGNFRLKDMPEGTYHLAEATPPTGYVKSTENYTIIIKHDGTTTLTTNAGRPVDGNKIPNTKQTAGHGGFAPTGGTITLVTLGIMLLVILGGVIASRNLMAANRE